MKLSIGNRVKVAESIIFENLYGEVIKKCNNSVTIKFNENEKDIGVYTISKCTFIMEG